MLYIGIPLAIIVALWLCGRIARASWYDVPTVLTHPTLRSGPESLDVGIVALTGAFNGPQHLERLIQAWRKHGNVYDVRYPIDLFDLDKTVEEVYHKIQYFEREYGHRRIVLMGYSLGGLVALLVWQLARKERSPLADMIELAVHDSPLTGAHLRIPGGAPVPGWFMPLWLWIAPKLRWLVRPGMLLNLLSGVVAKAAFVPMLREEREAGTDMDQLRRHMAFLRSNKLSLMASQVAAITSVSLSDLEGSITLPVTIAQCGRDDVVMSTEVAATWQHLFPSANVVQMPKYTRHVSAVEHHKAYLQVSLVALG